MIISRKNPVVTDVAFGRSGRRRHIRDLFFIINVITFIIICVIYDKSGFHEWVRIKK